MIAVRPACRRTGIVPGALAGMVSDRMSILPPPVLGIGTGSGYSLFLQDRAGLGHGELQHAVQNLSGALSQVPGMGFPFSSYQSNVPQLDAHVDRARAKAQGVALTDLFETLQVYLGSAYVNDFNRFGRTWSVIAQADAWFRTRNERGEMVPIGSMARIEHTYGPDDAGGIRGRGDTVVRHAPGMGLAVRPVRCVFLERRSG